MARYVTTTDNLVALNSTIPFNSVSIPCNNGNVIPLAPGILNLKGNTTNRFARYLRNIFDSFFQTMHCFLYIRKDCRMRRLLEY